MKAENRLTVIKNVLKDLLEIDKEILLDAQTTKSYSQVNYLDGKIKALEDTIRLIVKHQIEMEGEKNEG